MQAVEVRSSRSFGADTPRPGAAGRQGDHASRGSLPVPAGQLRRQASQGTPALGQEGKEHDARRRSMGLPPRALRVRAFIAVRRICENFLDEMEKGTRPNGRRDRGSFRTASTSIARGRTGDSPHSSAATARILILGLVVSLLPWDLLYGRHTP